jgi:uncharacterized protein
LELGDLKVVDLDDMKVFKEHYSKFHPQHSDYLHGIMYTWRDYMTYSFTKMNDSIILLGEHDKSHYIRPPIGPHDEEVFQEVIDLSIREGWNPIISMIGKETADWMQKEFPQFEYRSQREYFDYIYMTSNLADLPGKDYLKVRNYLNNFRKNNDHTVEAISRENIDEAKDFLIRWCEQKGCKDDPFLIQERQATFYALDDLFELGLEGIIIRVNGQVEAFSIFEEMRPDMAVVHYEKANFDMVGLYQAINNETAKFLSDRYKFIDRESDMGVPGLRRAKEKYRPHHMLEIYHADAVGHSSK